MILEALKPLSIPIGDVHSDPSNARRHPERNLEAIVASMSRFGQRSPIVVQKQGMIVRAGNGRLEAAKKLGWTHIAAVVVDESSVDATAFAIADNRTSDLAEWDDETLASLLDTLPTDLRDAAGYTEGELGSLLDSLRPEVTEDVAPEPLPDAVSRTGDLWECGGHRVLCGDCTIEADVDRVTGGKCDLCLTDPPYGVGEAYASHNDTKSGLEALVSGFLPIALRVARVVLLTPGNANQRMYPTPAWTLAWACPAGTGSGPWGFCCWQPVLAYGDDPYLSSGGGRRPDFLNHTESADNELGHPCPKPVGVWSWLIERGSHKRGQSVYDPFLGSGTTLVACEQLGRRCYAIEIEPRYVDVAVRRWQNLTGKAATLNGKTFAEVAEERGVKCQ